MIINHRFTIDLTNSNYNHPGSIPQLPGPGTLRFGEISTESSRDGSPFVEVLLHRALIHPGKPPAVVILWDIKRRY